MKTIVTDSIILKRIDYGEADRILTVLTKDQGKVQLIAKGVRRSKSRLAGGLELFSVTTVSFLDGKNELKTVVGSQLVEYFSDIVKDVDRTMLAYDLMKQVNDHTEAEAGESYFTLLRSSLEALNNEDCSSKIAQAWFLAQLLEMSGSGILLDSAADGSDFSEDATYGFDYDAMGFVHQGRGAFLPKHIKFLRLLCKAQSPSNLLKVSDAEEVLNQLLPLLQRCVKSLR